MPEALVTLHLSVSHGTGEWGTERYAFLFPITDIFQTIPDFKRAVIEAAQQHCLHKDLLLIEKSCWLCFMGVECDRDRSLDFFFLQPSHDAKICVRVNGNAWTKEMEMGMALSTGEMQICIETLTGRTTPITVSPFDTINAVKEKFQVKEGIPVEQQRLWVMGKQLADAITLKEYGIEQGSTLINVGRLRGGGGIEGAIFADISNDSALISREWSDSAPRWRIATMGLCVEGLCRNDRCEAFNKMVICNFGFSHFDLILDKASGKCCCPVCDKSFIPSTCGFNNCEWQYTGIKLDKSGQPVQVGNRQWREAGNRYERFSDASSNQVAWIRLLIVARQKLTRTEFTECSVCCDNIEAEGVQTPSPPCPRPHFFHRECISSWLRVSTTCPNCRAVVGDLSRCEAFRPQPK